MIRQSPSVKFVIMALVEFHKNTPQVVKDSLNHFNSRFASLSQVTREVDPYLNEVGLVLIQFPCVTEAGASGLDSMLAHVSGEWMAAEATLAMAKVSPQDQGSGLTYLRRYAACAILGIVADEDDDAEKAMSAHQAPARSSPAQPEFEEVNGEQIPLVPATETTRYGPVGELATPKQIGYAKKLLDDAGIGDGSAAEEWINKNCGPWPGSLNNLSKKQASAIISALK